MSAVFESKALGPVQRLVMLALADHADDQGRCYPSNARLCERTGLSERAVRQNIRALEDGGFLTVQIGAGQSGSNLYLVSPSGAADAPRHEMPPGTKRPTPRHVVPPSGAADAPKPSRTIIEPSRDRKRSAAEYSGILLALCDVVSVDTAEAFIEHRRAKGSKLTLKAAQLTADKVRGHPEPDAVLLNSIANGWTGVFPEKTKAKGSQNGQTDRRQFDAAINETARRLSDGTIKLDYSSRDPFAHR